MESIKIVGRTGSFRQNLAERREREKLLPSYYEEHPEEIRCCWLVWDKVWKNVKSVARGAWKMGKSDPRKVIFSAKVGLVLMLLSFMIFWKEPMEDLAKYSVWAILTVVVVFEFSIGATLSKGFNRGIGTLSAGGLALAMGELSKLVGDWEEMVVIMGIFITGSCITYAKLYPPMKPYEYGFRVFLITYCFIMISGYRTSEFTQTAISRFILIALGAAVALTVNICICPIWAGEDLHNVVAKNFTSVADSLEGCISGYLNCVEYKRVPSKILTYQASDDPVYSGYRSALESTSQEEALVSFAIWEPPHGPYKKFRFPWKDFVKVSGALRHCAFMVMALHGCILSEIQAPAEKRQVFRNELQRVGTASARVLQVLGEKVKKMEKLDSIDILFEVHDAVEALQKKIDKKSYLLVNSESWEIGKSENHQIIQDFISVNDHDDANGNKSPDEVVVHIQSHHLSKSWAGPPTESLNFNSDAGVVPSLADEEEKSSQGTVLPGEEDWKTYESASALSLATFASLLIEFVARLQNLVESFEELSTNAEFRKQADLAEAAEKVGFWTRLCRFLRISKREDILLM